MGTFPRSYGGAPTAVKPPPAELRRPTILDIAGAAGVSKTTVSRVLNGSPNVASETRDRVLAAIAELGFHVNHAARSLRTSRTGLVGFVVPLISIFGVIVEELDRELARDGIGILLAASRRRDPARDVDAIETLAGRGVDALVLAPSDDRSRELARYLRTLRAPVVLLDRDVRGVRCDAVLLDQGPGMHDALAFLAAQGRRRVGLLTRDRKTRPGREIIDRYAEASVAAGLGPPAPELVLEFDDLDQQAGRAGVDALVAAGADAILATGTMVLTASILERLGEHGLRVPGDVSLVAFGQLGTATAEHTRLPSVAYPVDAIARVTSRLVRARLAGSTAPPRFEHVPTVFVTP